MLLVRCVRLAEKPNVRNINSRNHYRVPSSTPCRNSRTFATKKCIVGTDEAGLGALLGPVGIIQVAVAAETAEAVNKAFAEGHTGVEKKDIHVQGKRGKKLDLVGNFSEMETMALGGVSWLSGGKVPATAAEFFEVMGEKMEERSHPWMQGAEKLKLPVSITEVQKWTIPGVDPLSWSGAIIHAPALNNARKEGVNRALLELEHIGKLLEKLPKGYDECDIYVDRLGGRKYYAEPIQKVWPDFQVETIEELPKKSVYTAVKGNIKRTITFPVSGEETTILIAVCSNIAKYARELHMKLFNNYWCERFPEVKPTDGYHNDGKRWIRSITKRDATVLPPIRDVIIREGLEMGLTFPGFRF